eukprot:3466600-Rhodomonas_salina.1
MFKESTAFNGDISRWDVSAVSDFVEMFASNRLDNNISTWDVSSAGNISQWDVRLRARKDLLWVRLRDM